MAFNLLTWTYFNDVSVGRNILMNSQQTKLRKTEKTWKKKITLMKVTSVKMRYQI